MALEHIRISQQARDQLIKLKRVTGIKHWNVLCRWALCASLAESSIPPAAKIVADSNVDMTWKVFGDPYEELYLALLRERCKRDRLPLTDEVLSAQFRLHLHRGIGYLAADKKLRNIGNLFERRVDQSAAE